MGVRGLMAHPLYAEDALGIANTEHIQLALVCSLGYFLFDGLWCVMHGDEDWTMLAHHVISIVRLPPPRRR